MTSSLCVKTWPRCSQGVCQARRSLIEWWTTAISPMQSAFISTPARLGRRSAMSSAKGSDSSERALLAIGTASYDYPDFPALDKVPDALRTVVGALNNLGFTTVVQPPGYNLDPTLPRLRVAVREAAAVAPVLIVYYTGHGADLERGT